MYNFAVLISGSGTNLQAVINAVESGDIPNAKVALVVSDREDASGLKRAQKHSIPNVVINKKDIQGLLQTLKAHETDGILLAGYLPIVPPELVEAYTGKIINIHPALLPMFGGKGYYGIRVHQAVLATGVKLTGATAHIVDDGIDTGAVLVQAFVPVLAGDTAEILQQRVLKTEYRVLVEAAKALASNKTAQLISNPVMLENDEIDRNGYMQAKKILIIGSGGREHAIGWKLKQNHDVKLYFAPGNAGTAGIGENINISVDELDKLVDFAKAYKMDFTAVGPELPLTLGVTDEFRKRGLRIFGPDAKGARLEGSKAFAKYFMRKYNIPTAEYDVVVSIDEGLRILEKHNYPLVVKANGLAEGKGVIICADKNEATAALNDMLEKETFGEAGNKVVIEEFLTGKEISLLCFTDSETIKPMESASDYKRALDNNMGANTGGMGSISPSPYYTSGLGDDIANKTLEGIKSEGFDYRGVIYIGLMLTSDGPKVLEYNSRFGDPETQALLPRLETDLVQVMEAVIDKNLSDCKLKWSEKHAVSVVLASKGYPGTYEAGFPIDIEETTGTVFHSRTKIVAKKPVTDGGRVLAVTALGTTLDEAREAVYSDIEEINFQGKTYRKDIGKL